MTTAVRASLRADARRNHHRILDAARDVFVERGPDAPLEEIARRARVGIGTLYRRFPDRGALMEAVVMAALTATAEAAQRAIDEEDDPLRALIGYMHAVLDLRTSAVIPTLLDRVDLHGPVIRPARDHSAALLQRLIDNAHQAGGLREEVSFGDVGVLLVRLSRPLPGSMPEAIQQELAHRHLDLAITGLTTHQADDALPGPALERRDLHALNATYTPDIGSDRPEGPQQDG
jgi:AcrR family transcriptional regulator